MPRFQVIVLALCCALPAAALADAPSPAPSGAAATPSPAPDPAVLARAKTWFHMMQTGKIDKSQLDATMAGLLTDDVVAGMAAKIGPLGDPVTFEQVQTGTVSGNAVYVYELAFGNGTKLDFVFAVDGNGKVSGLRLKPSGT